MTNSTLIQVGIWLVVAMYIYNMFAMTYRAYKADREAIERDFNSRKEMQRLKHQEALESLRTQRDNDIEIMRIRMWRKRNEH